MVEESRVPGERLYLRAIRHAEAASILSGVTPAGLRFADGYPSQASLEVMDIFAGERQDPAAGFRPFFIVREIDDAIIGDIGWSTPDGPAAPVVGYDVAEPLWGQGYATAALRVLINHLFERPEVERICADTTRGHVASRRVMEKAGMCLVREAIQEVDGEAQDLVHYEIARQTE